MEFLQIGCGFPAPWFLCYPHSQYQKVKELHWYLNSQLDLNMFKGLSCKAQELYLIVFCTRYLDVFYRFSDQTLYLLTMKIIFVSATAYLIYLMRVKTPYREVRSLSNYSFISNFTKSYDASADNFKHWRFLIPGSVF